MERRGGIGWHVDSSTPRGLPLLDGSSWRFGRRRFGRGRSFLLDPARFSFGRGEGATQAAELAHLLLADLPALGRHVRSLAVEDARHQLGVGPLRLPRGNGKVGDLRQEAARVRLPVPSAPWHFTRGECRKSSPTGGVPSAAGADSWTTLCCPDSDGFDRIRPGKPGQLAILASQLLLSVPEGSSSARQKLAMARPACSPCPGFSLVGAKPRT